MSTESLKELAPNLGYKYAHLWFNSTPHGVWELAPIIAQAILEGIEKAKKVK